MYDILLSETAKRQLEKLPHELQTRIGIALERIRVRPFHFVARLVGSPYFRLRVGDYRVILDIQQNTLTLFVIEMGHRRNIHG